MWRPWQDTAASVFPPPRSRSLQEDMAARDALEETGNGLEMAGGAIQYTSWGLDPPLHWAWAARLTSHGTWRARRRFKSVPGWLPSYLDYCVHTQHISRRPSRPAGSPSPYKIHLGESPLFIGPPCCSSCHTTGQPSLSSLSHGKVEPRKFPNRAMYDQVSSLLPPRLTQSEPQDRHRPPSQPMLHL